MADSETPLADCGREVSGVVVGDGSGEPSSYAEEDEEPSEARELSCGATTSLGFA